MTATVRTRITVQHTITDGEPVIALRNALEAAAEQWGHTHGYDLRIAAHASVEDIEVSA